MQRVGMCDSTLPVAVRLIKYAEIKQYVVEHQKQERPLHKREIKPSDTLHAESPGVVDTRLRKEISGSDEKHRHMEKIYKPHKHVATFGMACNHKDDSHTLHNRHNCVTWTGLISCCNRVFHITAKFSYFFCNFATSTPYIISYELC